MSKCEYSIISSKKEREKERKGGKHSKKMVLKYACIKDTPENVFKHTGGHTPRVSDLAGLE